MQNKRQQNGKVSHKLQIRATKEPHDESALRTNRIQTNSYTYTNKQVTTTTTTTSFGQSRASLRFIKSNNRFTDLHKKKVMTREMNFAQHKTLECVTYT